MKKESLKKLKDKLDKLWSEKVRKRDNKCILCGKYQDEPKSLQAHHWILTRNQSSKYRWDLRNGVSLCYGCHIHQIHKNPSVELIDRLTNLCLINGIATQEDINELIKNRHELTKINKSFLEQKESELNDEN